MQWTKYLEDWSKMPGDRRKIPGLIARTFRNMSNTLMLMSYCFTLFPQFKGESDERYRVSDKVNLASLTLSKVNNTGGYDYMQVYVPFEG